MFLFDYNIIGDQKRPEKKDFIKYKQDVSPSQGFLSKTENRVGRKGVTYRYQDNETSVPRCQVR